MGELIQFPKGSAEVERDHQSYVWIAAAERNAELAERVMDVRPEITDPTATQRAKLHSYTGLPYRTR